MFIRNPNLPAHRVPVTPTHSYAFATLRAFHLQKESAQGDNRSKSLSFPDLMSHRERAFRSQ